MSGGSVTEILHSAYISAIAVFPDGAQHQDDLRNRALSPESTSHGVSFATSTRSAA